MKIAAAMQPVAQSLALAVADESRLACRLNLDLPISSLAALTGQVLRTEPIFMHNGRVVIVDEATGAMEPMTRELFPSWVEQYAIVRKGEGDRERTTSMGFDVAAKILAAKQFQSHLRKLAGIYPVRLPVWGDAERNSIRLAPAGYDAESGVLTLDLLSYDTELDPLVGVEALREMLCGYPWADQTSSLLAWQSNPNVARHLAAMLSPFCRLLLNPLEKRPGVFYNSNQPGTGKTTLAKFGLMAVYGEVETTDRPESKKDLADLLDTWACEGKDYLFLDDVEGLIRSNAMNSFMTAGTRAGRVKGFTASFKGRITTQLFLTGNSVNVTPDLARRFLVVELFCAADAPSRQFASEINEAWLAQRENRSRILAALCSLVMEWSRCGCPLNARTLGGFGEFSRIIGGICTACMFADPITPPAVVMDEASEAWMKLFRALAGEVLTGETHSFPVGDCLDKAGELGIFDALVGFAKDERKAFGQRIKKWKGREFTDDLGRKFRFGRRETGFGSSYDITVFADTREDGH